MPDLDAMQLAAVGAALEECVENEVYDVGGDGPDWGLVESALAEGDTLDEVREGAQKAIDDAVADWQSGERCFGGFVAEHRWLGEVLVRELAYRGFKIVRAG